MATAGRLRGLAGGGIRSGAAWLGGSAAGGSASSNSAASGSEELLDEERRRRPAPGGSAGGSPNPVMAWRNVRASVAAGAASGRMTNFCVKLGAGVASRDSEYSDSMSSVRVCEGGGRRKNGAIYIHQGQEVHQRRVRVRGLRVACECRSARTQ